MLVNAVKVFGKVLGELTDDEKFKLYQYTGADWAMKIVENEAIKKARSGK